jgi:hypothetical protein
VIAPFGAHRSFTELGTEFSRRKNDGASRETCLGEAPKYSTPCNSVFF